MPSRPDASCVVPTEGPEDLGEGTETAHPAPRSPHPASRVPVDLAGALHAKIGAAAATAVAGVVKHHGGDDGAEQVVDDFGAVLPQVDGIKPKLLGEDF